MSTQVILRILQDQCLSSLVQPPLDILTVNVALAVYAALGADLTAAAKPLDRLGDNIDDVLGTDVEVDVALLVEALDTKLVPAKLYDLVLLVKRVLDLLLALGTLDIIDDVYIVASRGGYVLRTISLDTGNSRNGSMIARLTAGTGRQLQLTGQERPDDKCVPAS
jgi:hypothetical protein